MAVPLYETIYRVNSENPRALPGCIAQNVSSYVLAKYRVVRIQKCVVELQQWSTAHSHVARLLFVIDNRPELGAPEFDDINLMAHEVRRFERYEILKDHNVANCGARRLRNGESDGFGSEVTVEISEIDENFRILNNRPNKVFYVYALFGCGAASTSSLMTKLYYNVLGGLVPQGPTIAGEVWDLNLNLALSSNRDSNTSNIAFGFNDDPPPVVGRGDTVLTLSLSDVDRNNNG